MKFITLRDLHWFLSGASGIAWGVWLGDTTTPRLALAITLTVIQAVVSFRRAFATRQTTERVEVTP